jgi:hypothetical protein
MWCSSVSRQSAVLCGVLCGRLGCISQGADAVQFSGSGPVRLHPFDLCIRNYGSPLFHHNASGWGVWYCERWYVVKCIVNGEMLWNVLWSGMIKTSGRILDWYDSDLGNVSSQSLSFCLSEINKLISTFLFLLIQGCSFKTSHCLGHVVLAAIMYWIFFNAQNIITSLNGLC